MFGHEEVREEVDETLGQPHPSLYEESRDLHGIFRLALAGSSRDHVDRVRETVARVAFFETVVARPLPCERIRFGMPVDCCIVVAHGCPDDEALYEMVAQWSLVAPLIVLSDGTARQGAMCMQLGARDVLESQPHPSSLCRCVLRQVLRHQFAPCRGPGDALVALLNAGLEHPATRVDSVAARAHVDSSTLRRAAMGSGLTPLLLVRLCALFGVLTDLWTHTHTHTHTGACARSTSAP